MGAGLPPNAEDCFLFFLILFTASRILCSDIEPNFFLKMGYADGVYV